MKRIICSIAFILSLTLTSCEKKIPEYPGITPTTEETGTGSNRYTYSSTDYVISLDDKGITLLDFFLDIKSASVLNGVDYMESALNYMIDIYRDVLVIESIAEANNIELTEAEKAEVDEEVNALVEGESLSIIEMGLVFPFWERLYKNLYLYERVGDLLLAEDGYAFNETEFQAEYEKFLAEEKSEYIRADFTYILLDDEVSIKGVQAELQNGVKLDTAYLEKYTSKSYKDFGYNYINLWYLNALGLINSDQIEELLQLKIGEISSIIQNDEGYAIFMSEARQDLTDEETVELFRERYDDERRAEVLLKKAEKMEAEGRYVLNRNLLDNLDLNELITDFDPYALFSDLTVNDE